MITLTNLKTTIIALIKPLGLKVYGSEIKQGFDRPCFFVQLMPLAYDAVTTNFSENLTTVEIVYFSLNETDLENIQMYDSLKSIFSIPIPINGRKILAQKIRSSTEEYVMSFEFDMNYLDNIIKDEPTTSIATKLILTMKEE